MTKAHFSILLAIALLTIGCATAQPAVVVTATPAPGYTAPMPTYSDPAKQAIVVVNTADALYAQATQEAMMRQATVSAATQAAAAAQAAVVQATAAQIAAVATATAVQLDLQRAIINVTATAGALRLADTMATQEAARAADLMDAQRSAAEGRARDKTAGDIMTVLGLLFVAVLVYAAFALADALRTWVKAKVAINARRGLVLILPDGRAGQYLVEEERWELPATVPGRVVEAPATMPTINRHRPEPDAERAARDQWRDALERWLLWTDAEAEDGAPVGTSRRRFMAATRATRADYQNGRDQLVRLGVLILRGGEYVIRDEMTGAQAARLPVLTTSFDVPAAVKCPELPEPPPAQPGPGRPVRPSPAQQPAPDLENAVYASRGLALPFSEEPMS